MSLLNADDELSKKEELPSKIPALTIAALAWALLFGFWRGVGIKSIFINLLDGVLVVLTYHLYRKWQIKRMS